MTAEDVCVLYLVRGLPGSGKTTLARKLTTGRAGSVMFAADDFFRHPTGEYRFKVEQLTLAHLRCQQSVCYAMECEVPQIVVHNTFTRVWEMAPYREMAERYGYQVIELTVESGLSDDQLAARNVHSVPADAIARMRARWQMREGSIRP